MARILTIALSIATSLVPLACFAGRAGKADIPAGARFGSFVVGQDGVERLEHLLGKGMRTITPAQAQETWRFRTNWRVVAVFDGKSEGHKVTVLSVEPRPPDSKEIEARVPKTREGALNFREFGKPESEVLARLQKFGMKTENQTSMPKGEEFLTSFQTGSVGSGKKDTPTGWTVGIKFRKGMLSGIGIIAAETPTSK